eukprot:1226485-Prymnesium_polylepis.1
MKLVVVALGVSCRAVTPCSLRNANGLRRRRAAARAAANALVRTVSESTTVSDLWRTWANLFTQSTSTT